MEIINNYKIEGMNTEFGYYVSNITRLPFVNKKGLISVKEIKLYNFITLDNKLVFDNWIKYIDFYDSSEDILIFSTIVNDEKVFGAFNKEGKIIASAVFNSIDIYKKDYLLCKLNDKEIIYDKNGEQLSLCECAFLKNNKKLIRRKTS